MIEALQAPFPQFAYKDYKIGSLVLTSLRAGAIVDRLHSVFGVGNVLIFDKTPLNERLQKLEDGRYVVHYLGSLVLSFKDEDGHDAHFEIPLSGMDLLPSLKESLKETKYGVYTEGRVVEDVWKGCRTNAISKAAFEHLGIGSKMYMGLMPYVGDKVVEYDGDSSFPERRSGSPGEPKARSEEAPTGPAADQPKTKHNPRSYALEFARSNKEEYIALATEAGFAKEVNGKKVLVKILEMTDKQFATLHKLLTEKSKVYASNLPKDIK